MGSRGRTEGSIARRSEWRVGDTRTETREGQFDVNRSIVIRVNRLPLFVDGPRRPAEHNSRFVLYFIPRVVEKCRCCLGCEYLWLPTTRSYNRRVTDNKTQLLQGVEIDIFELSAYSYHSKLRSQATLQASI